MIELLLNQK